MMNHYRRSGWIVALFAAVLILLAMQATAIGADDNEKNESEAGTSVHVDAWLVLGPARCPLPAFNGEDGTKIGAKDLLEYEHIPYARLAPDLNESIHIPGGAALAWAPAAADTTGAMLAADSAMPSVAYLAAYIESPRWLKIGLAARCTQPFEITIDGKSVVKRVAVGEMTGNEAAKKADAKLEEGKHLLVVKTVCVPGDTLPDWRFDLSMSAAEKFGCEPVVSLDPSRPMNIGDVLDGPDVRVVRVSPDGRLYAVSMSKRIRPEGEPESWLEIRRFKDGSVVQTLRDMSDASDWQWVPVGRKLSYVTTEDEAASVRVIDLDTGVIRTIVDGVKDFSGYDWSPDATFIAYSVTKKPEKNETGVTRLRSVADRRSYERNLSSLYIASVPEGMTRRVTAGEHSTFIYDVHPDGKSLLVGRTYEDLSERPYSTTELIRVNLDDQSTDVLWKGHWIARAIWSPDGKKILVTAGPTEFGAGGVNVPEGTIPNDYDTQAYLFDPGTKTAEPLTKTFAPAINAVYWPEEGGDIYFVAEDGEYVRLYRYDLKKKTFKTIDVGCDVIRRGDVARVKPVGAFTGSGATHPGRLYTVEMDKGKSQEALDPKAERFKNVRLGTVEDWDFESSGGGAIVGRIYYPPDFSRDRKWPCIVYYYGGTSPVDRSFGGRYPKNLWAAFGYVVYVLQPSGATGFGQGFSARHVNDWGKTVAGEIIEGTEKFLAAHDFVDPERVGCIGASFGGFMTELLVTRTDMFAAAVSHAGISSISSYWGEGYWGYEYNAVSAANSFPWNRPDIYIEQSPLFSVDKINTPLLLLHGTADTNVPTGESEQMYAALKLLGKEVEYIRVEGQNHLILDYKKRMTWSDAILAWFDRWLKDEPEWWNDMYPPLDESGGNAGQE